MRVLITGAGGQLGHDVAVAFAGEVPPGGRRRALFGPAGPAATDVEVVATTHAELPVDDRARVLSAVLGLRPDVVVHAGAYTAVDACESDPDTAFAVNALGTRHVAEAAAHNARWLPWLAEEIAKHGIEVAPSVGNFLLLRFSGAGEAQAAKAKARGYKTFKNLKTMIYMLTGKLDYSKAGLPI